MPALRSKSKGGPAARGRPPGARPTLRRETGPGRESQESWPPTSWTRSKLEATPLRKRGEGPVPKKPWEGCKTDPEPDMGSGRASARNVRSKCR